MSRSKHVFNRIVLKNLLAGAAFGLLFPFAAIVLVIAEQDLGWSVAGIIHAHRGNTLLYIIDSAPFFLGIFSSIAGVNQARLRDAKRQREEQILSDELTKINNRQFGQLKLAELIPDAKRRKHRLALIFLDIDRFKSLNDNMGHRFGDQVLIALARKLKESLLPGEFVARIGGDEFMLISPAIKEIGDAESLAGRFIDICLDELQIDNKLHRISVSMGIAVFPEHGVEMEQLFKHADVALFENKNTRKGRFSLFDPMLMQAVNEEFILEKELQKAIPNGELSLCYQPIVDCRTHAICGAEALLRWHSIRLGPVSPDKFIPIAEKSSLILDIGHWVLFEACRQNRLWQQAGLPPIVVSVNVSANQLTGSHFAEAVDEALDAAGLEARFLKLEITETASMENVVEVKEIFGQLRKKNILLSIDDFGTGYSSLSKLKSLSIDDLKIDKSFIADIKVNAGTEHLVIVEAIVAMAKKLNIKVVAEGVETATQVEVLTRFECDYLQGYLFSKPLNADGFSGLLRRGITRLESGENTLP